MKLSQVGCRKERGGRGYLGAAAFCDRDKAVSTCIQAFDGKGRWTLTKGERERQKGRDGGGGRKECFDVEGGVNIRRMAMMMNRQRGAKYKVRVRVDLS